MHELNKDGFEIVNTFFSGQQVEKMLNIIDSCNSERPAFRKSQALFAIRRFINEMPAIYPLIFTPDFQELLEKKAGQGYELVKSIYFDKPGQSNWFVSYHQDLTLSVKKKVDHPGFGPWTIKQDQFSVQPPKDILEDNITVRIHLDNTTDDNGALRVIPQSHKNGIVRYNINGYDNFEDEYVCNVTQGGIMFMKPLLLHSSGRTTNNSQRRVIHLEFSRSALPDEIEWAEKAS